MIFEARPITLKDGRCALLKSPCTQDARQMLDYITRACGETDFLARYPEEWTTTVEQEQEWIGGMLSSPDALTIACYLDGRVIGNCEIDFMTGIKTAHRATVSIALLRDFWGLGIGSAMFDALIEAAKSRNTEILELEFIEGNDRARHLYEKFGFHIVASKPNAFRLRDGSTRSEIYMQKYLTAK